MRQMLTNLFAVATLFFGSTLANSARAGDYDHYDGDSVICESKKGRTQYCGIDTRYGVILIEQYSKTRCIQGQTWGYDRRGVWVQGGCRAAFGAAPPPRQRYRDDGRYDNRHGNSHGNSYGNEGSVFRCESRDYGQTYCSLPFRGQVELVRQLSRTSCEYGRDWGQDRRGVWVANGCRAEFSVY